MSRLNTTAEADSSPAEDGLLRQFLDRRDIRCPSCGYNLRSAGGGTCPECGGRLVLSLDSPDPLLRRRGLLLLLFAWLLLAGSMNAVRSGRQVYRMLTSSSQVVWIGNVGQGGTLMPTAQVLRTAEAWSASPDLTVTMESDRSAAPEVTFDPPDDGQGPASGRWSSVDPSLRSVEARIGAALAAPELQLAVTPFARPSRPSWSVVSWPSWAHLGGWSALAVIATIGLAIVLWHRHRPVTAARARLLMIMAWLSFGGYFAYHGARFVVEVV